MQVMLSSPPGGSILVRLGRARLLACSRVHPRRHHIWRACRSFATSVSEKEAAATPADDLRSLLERASLKVPGSARHKRLWRHYSHRHFKAIETVLRRTLGPLVDPIATSRLETDLGRVGANAGVMPDFSDAGALAGYALDHFGRARLLADLLVRDRPDWLRLRMEELFPYAPSSSGCGGVFPSPSCRVASLGGGPGYDFLGLAALSDFRRGPDVRAVVYEYEPRWERIVASMEEAARAVCGDGRHSCGFRLCDITLPLETPVNAALAERATSVDVVVCSYCVAENALRLRELNFAFFSHLFAEALHGTLFFFTETTHRMWPELADVAAAAGLRVAFPHVSGSGKVGWQLVLLKDDSPGSIMIDDVLLYSKFKADNEAHLARLRRGWKRHTRKIRGAK